MSTIIAQPGQQAQPTPDATVGIFLAHGLQWQHFRGNGTISGAQEIYDPGHPAEVTWLLPGEDPEEL